MDSEVKFSKASSDKGFDVSNNACLYVNENELVYTSGFFYKTVWISGLLCFHTFMIHRGFSQKYTSELR